MSRQIKKITAQPIGKNEVRIVLDQQDYVADGATDLVVVRTTDHFPLTSDTVHTAASSGGQYIIGAGDRTAYTSGLGVDVTGYDALICSADGYTRSRGIVQNYSSVTAEIYGFATVSVSGKHYIIGGYDHVLGEYTTAVWYAGTGNWSLLAAAPWSARAWHGCVTDGTYIYVVGGVTNTVGTTPVYANDIWRGTIEADGTITWDDAALHTELSLEQAPIKATIDATDGIIFTGTEAIDLATGNETAHTLTVTDGYDSCIHFDKIRSLLWSSNGSTRDEWYAPLGVVTSQISEFGYTHYQSVASDTWTIAHGLGSLAVAPICYSGDKEIMIPAGVTYTDENNIIITWNVAVTGRAFVCFSSTYSSDTWQTPTDSTDGEHAWWAISDAGDLLGPTVVDDDTLSFSTSTSGHFIYFGALGGVNLINGRNYIFAGNGSSGDNTVTTKQYGNTVLPIIRKSTSNQDIIEPASYDYTDGDDVVFNLTDAESDLMFGSMWMRHDNLPTLADPWTATYVSQSECHGDNLLYIVNSDGELWKSSFDGAMWEAVSFSGFTPHANRNTPIVHSNVFVGSQDSDHIMYRSLDLGATFSAVSAGLENEQLDFYDNFCVPVSAGNYLFIYPRPSDVVWQSTYGHLPGVIIDDYSDRYVLPSLVSAAGFGATSATITLNSSYGRNVIANEFVDDWMYFYSATTGLYVEKAQIKSNTAGTAGSTFDVTYEAVSITPSSAYCCNIIKNRKEGLVYYTCLHRNTVDDYDVLLEADGSHFLLAQERDADYYAQDIIKSHLPSYVSEIYSENDKKLDVLHTENNRRRASVDIHYADPYDCGPGLIEQLAYTYGIDADDSTDYRTLRHAIAHWVDLVDAYGPCLDGAKNIVNLILGSDSGVTITSSLPSAATDCVAGKYLTINFADYANKSYDYSATNDIYYSTVESMWASAASSTDIGTDVGVLSGMYLCHIRDQEFQYVTIKKHDIDTITSEITLYSDDSTMSGWVLSADSDFYILDVSKFRKVIKVLNIIKKFVPSWITIKYN